MHNCISACLNKLQIIRLKKKWNTRLNFVDLDYFYFFFVKCTEKILVLSVETEADAMAISRYVINVQ